MFLEDGNGLRSVTSPLRNCYVIECNRYVLLRNRYVTLRNDDVIVLQRYYSTAEKWPKRAGAANITLYSTTLLIIFTMKNALISNSMVLPPNKVLSGGYVHKIHLKIVEYKT